MPTPLHTTKICSIAVALVALTGVGASAQRDIASTRPDIDGAWERHGGFVAGPRIGTLPRPPDRATIPPPPTPPSLKPEYVKEWQSRVQAAREAEANGQPLATGYTNCLPDGVPSMMAAMFPLEFIQSKGQVTIIEEAYNQVRRVLMDKPQQAVDDVEPGFYGHAVGHWEGETLVVDTIGIKETIRYQNVPHSKDLRVRERIHLVRPDILWDEITMDDPVVLEKPWTVTYAYRRMPDYTLLEYICEDNREYADERGLQKIRIGPREK